MQEDMSPFLKSPMPGTVVSIAVSVGETVRHTFGWSDKPLPPAHVSCFHDGPKAGCMTAQKNVGIVSYINYFSLIRCMKDKN